MGPSSRNKPYRLYETSQYMICQRFHPYTPRNAQPTPCGHVTVLFCPLPESTPTRRPQKIASTARIAGRSSSGPLAALLRATMPAKRRAPDDRRAPSELRDLVPHRKERDDLRDARRTDVIAGLPARRSKLRSASSASVRSSRSGPDIEARAFCRG